jgi:hypothetical protein
MRTVFITYFILISATILMDSCSKDKPVYSETPEIGFVSVSSTNITEGDPLTFVISYVDGDGDLGENNPNVYNMFLTDTRVNVTYKYRIPQLAPGNSTIIIKGKLDLLLNGTAITDGSNSQSVIYTIHVVDRSGHQSNSVTSPLVTIHN